ncbi:hydantoinase/oxoprolinase family protein [Bacillus sp. B190/17]|uniref:Hydantoinase/oxoprolinase family protein n=1 Tax=Bacillus lumedeiriae TaxID=3058829 RepID=A0ABW8IBA1_9BACI
MKQESYRLGIDAGGTFTDFIVQSSSGDIKVFKSPSTPDQPSSAILNGLKLISTDLGISVAEFLQRCHLIIHGTTVALNALIEHKGAKVGLFCTQGHEDSLEIRLGHKEDGFRYDFTYPPAKMLVPRKLRVPVRERTRSDGKVLTPLNEEDIIAGIEHFKKEGIEAIAVSYVWSFLNPEHEKRTAELIREHFPGAYISLSTEIFPQIREYTRVSTTVVNAYIGPMLKRYIHSLEALFQELGYQKEIRYVQNNGGVISGRTLTQKAIYALNSGPAAGPLAGLYFADQVKSRNVLTVDMGGTSLDISLTSNGRTEIIKDSDFMRYRIGTPMLHVETLGAGGGSIASVDSKGLFSVGPESAGALPGPVCYGKGGSQPTVTDSLVLLGYLDQDSLLGGRMKVDVQGANDAIKKTIADRLGLSTEKAALGIYQIVNNNMVGSINRVSVEKGHDPRDFILVAAGGAGGAHAARLAEELEIDRVIVPKIAGAFCAFGAILADVKHTYMSSFTHTIAEINPEELNKAFSEMEQQGIQQLLEEGFEREDIYIERTMDMRYRDQLHECTVQVKYEDITNASLIDIENRFHKRHEELYTYCERDNAVEVISLESTVCGRVPKITLSEGQISQQPEQGLPHYSTRNAYFEEYDGYRETPIYKGFMLADDSTVSGPAIIEEETTTVVVPPKWNVKVMKQGGYLLEKAEVKELVRG